MIKKEISPTPAFAAKAFLKEVSSHPGIYQMYNASDEVLYIGKARNLKKRLSSYFRGQQASLKTSSLVSQIQRIETIITRSENEALLLESTLIKEFKPRYNILLRDDKSYPYIMLTDEEFPQMAFYRGPKIGKHRYFGPYPSSTAVRETLHLLQKLFRIRTCENVFFQHRHRACLHYQIGRCSGPCVGLVDLKAYQEDVERAVLFLQGKNQAVIEDLVKQMELASTNLEFEKAALYRNQIAQLRQIQQQQIVISGQSDTDIIALAAKGGSVCVQVMSIRAGRLLGGKAFFPTVPAAYSNEEVLTAFLSQYYLSDKHLQDIPRQIILSHKLAEITWIATTLSEQAQHTVKCVYQPRGERARWLEMALQNAEQALTQHAAERASIQQRLQVLQEVLALPSLPHRLECFDISHSQGEATVASCVVFDEQGPRKSDYRRFNIENITPGDDYAAMRQALSRRYSHIKDEPAKQPDILIIDGGKGQLKQAEEVLGELHISDVIILAIAKGPGRKAGLETLWLSGERAPLAIDPESLAFHLIQQIRDEAHRFAITGHCGRRAKARRTSVLESIPGIGAKRRRELLRQFGGLQELKRASIEELAKIPGISKELATRIYQALL